MAVRLTEGDFAREKVYGSDPVAIAHRHRQAGARRIHVVDLDAAIGRAATNREVVKRIVAEAGLKVQVAGGVRDEVTAVDWLGAGAAAVVMGTAAIRHPDRFASIASGQCSARSALASWKRSAPMPKRDGSPPTSLSASSRPYR